MRSGYVGLAVFITARHDFIARLKGGVIAAILSSSSAINLFSHERQANTKPADEPWPDEAKVHAAMVTRMDRDVGRIMALLKELGLDERTIVFFCSDNGAARRWEGIFDSSGTLRGKKGALFEGGLRTPMIARWPGHIQAGATSRAPWYFADFLPTAAALGGAEPA